MRALAACAFCFAGAAAAMDTAQWPPPAADEARMRELQRVIGSRDSTRGERDAARAELGRLMMGPAAKAGPLPQIRRRAAIDPFPSVIKSAPAPTPIAGPMPDVARLEVVTPPKPSVNPQTGSAASPTGRFAIDPRTGNILHETAAGFIDPRTGHLVPR